MHLSLSNTGSHPVREVDRSFHAVLPGVGKTPPIGAVS
jgi:hypothetical protein